MREQGSVFFSLRVHAFLPHSLLLEREEAFGSPLFFSRIPAPLFRRRSVPNSFLLEKQRGSRIASVLFKCSRTSASTVISSNCLPVCDLAGTVNVWLTALFWGPLHVSLSTWFSGCLAWFLHSLLFFLSNRRLSFHSRFCF